MPPMPHMMTPWLASLSTAAVENGLSDGADNPSVIENTSQAAWWKEYRGSLLPPPQTDGFNPRQMQADPWTDGKLASMERKRLDDPTRISQGFSATVLAGLGSDQPFSIPPVPMAEAASEELIDAMGYSVSRRIQEKVVEVHACDPPTTRLASPTMRS